MTPFTILPFCFAAFLHLTGASNLHENPLDTKRSHVHRANHEKRGFSGHATYFADGLGACGGWSSPGDYIVALNSPQYGGGQDCGKQIIINGLGKSAQATIADECPGCPYGCLDMSSGLFQHFADLGVGEFPITWNWVGAGDDEPTTTHTPPPRPTTTRQTTSTTSSTSSATPTTSSTATTTDTASSGSATNTASSVPDGDGGDSGASVQGGGNIAAQQQFVYVMGRIATYGKSVGSS